jgi:hypothetical protein
VLSEIVVGRLENPNWQQVFPGYAGYSPLGIVRPILFNDGFESGTAGNWSAAIP